MRKEESRAGFFSVISQNLSPVHNATSVEEVGFLPSEATFLALPWRMNNCAHLRPVHFFHRGSGWAFKHGYMVRWEPTGLGQAQGWECVRGDVMYRHLVDVGYQI